MAEITISTAAGATRAWLANPATGGLWPGVVVLHDAAGMSQDLRNQADWLAGEGYLAIAPDLYSPDGKLRCIRELFRDAAALQGRFIAEIEAARDWLKRHERCTGKVGVIGFCMGGAFALLLAPGHGFSVSSVNYGGALPKDADSLLVGSCPIVGSYGAKDRFNRGVAAHLERVLTAARVEHEVKEYSDAGHSFLNDHQDALFRMLKVVGIGYHGPSARDARRRIADFFGRHLR